MGDTLYVVYVVLNLQCQVMQKLTYKPTLQLSDSLHIGFP